MSLGDALWVFLGVVRLILVVVVCSFVSCGFGSLLLRRGGWLVVG